jgi:hypothetical protein
VEVRRVSGKAHPAGYDKWRLCRKAKKVWPLCFCSAVFTVKLHKNKKYGKRRDEIAFGMHLM